MIAEMHTRGTVVIEIGGFRIDRVEEVVLDEDPSLLPHFNDTILSENRDWMVPHFFNEERRCFNTTIHTWILRDGTRTIVIDTGGGDDKDRPLSPRFHMQKHHLDERLRAAGVEANEVDTVLLTHLHVDHVGWNTRRDGERWVPMFPNAEYVVTATELEARDPERGAAQKPPASWNVYLDCVKPVLEAGQMRIVEGDETFAPGIDFVPIPGHAPGMMGIRVRSGGKEAFFIADVMHQPIQVYHPDWNSKYCENQPLARETRAKVLKHAADEGALFLPAHFNTPYCGYVRSGAGGYVFEPSPAIP
jgi:glyoxylase-like metal-dependent hydrolase (beta-lactamase superfamily II)